MTEGCGVYKTPQPSLQPQIVLEAKLNSKLS
jgi:hypothetical protein